MYEGMFSLMQMAKTSAAIAFHGQKKLPYISVLTHPTTAGVMASYASLGDLIISEPKAMIGFAGPRVIKDTTQSELPEGFQTAEFLMERGLRFDQRIVDKLQNRVLAISKGIVQRLFDHKVGVADRWVIDMGNAVTHRTGDTRL